MSDKTKQVKTFTVQGSEDRRLAPEERFNRLHKAEHPETRKGRLPLEVQHDFSRCGGSNTFIINLASRKTRKFVEAVVKDALGPGYSVECTNRTKTDKFLPGKRRPTGKNNISVIEREAAAWAEGSTSARFILVCTTKKVVYSYNDQRGLEKGNTEPRGAHIDVGSAADTAQVRSMVLVRGKQSKSRVGRN